MGRQGGTMAQWNDDAVVRWRGGSMAQWFDGAVVRWRGGMMAAISPPNAIVALSNIHKSLAIRAEICYNEGVPRVTSDSYTFGTNVWGCRVSTDEQIVELQAEVSVCTLVKQLTKQ